MLRSSGLAHGTTSASFSSLKRTKQLVFKLKSGFSLAGRGASVWVCARPRLGEDVGHTRLGTLPKSQSWREIAAMFAASGGQPEDDVPEGTERTTDFGHEVTRIAEKAMEGAAGAFERARRDPGIADAFFLLTRVAIACRSDGPAEALWQLGVQLPPQPTPVNVLSEVNRVLDETAFALGRQSDFREMAQAAIGEALAGWLRDKTSQADMFAPLGNKLWADLRGLASQDGFADVSHRAFAGLTSKLLGFYLSRAAQPLKEEGLICGVADLQRFENELGRHSLERARIAKDFAGTWFTKHEFQRGGIDLTKTRRFVDYAMKKVADELRGGRRKA